MAVEVVVEAAAEVALEVAVAAAARLGRWPLAVAFRPSDPRATAALGAAKSILQAETSEEFDWVCCQMWAFSADLTTASKN